MLRDRPGDSAADTPRQSQASKPVCGVNKLRQNEMLKRSSGTDFDSERGCLLSGASRPPSPTLRGPKQLFPSSAGPNGVGPALDVLRNDVETVWRRAFPEREWHAV